MPAFFLCKKCGQEHVSPLFFADENSFTSQRQGAMTLSCPVTGKTAPYEKKDMVWIRGERKPTHALR